MNYTCRRISVCLLLLLSIPTLARAQVADDSREKSENVNEILAALQTEAGNRIADVGAGEGFYSIRIARAVGSTGRVTAVDVSEKHLEKLRARLQQDSLTNVDLVVGAVDDPRLASNTFDAVLIYNAYHEMTAPEPVLDVHARSPCRTDHAHQLGRWSRHPCLPLRRTVRANTPWTRSLTPIATN